MKERCCNISSSFSLFFVRWSNTAGIVLWRMILLVLFWLVVSSTFMVNAHDESIISPFKIIIDGGSTGSRLHVFEFVKPTPTENYDDDSSSTLSSTTIPTSTSNTNDDNDNDDDNEEIVCIRRGSIRVDIPLSSFARLPSEQKQQPLNGTYIAEHLLPLFEYAAEIIPAPYYTTTSVTYQATAGMRLLDISEQDAIYQALYDGLLFHKSFVFHGMKRTDITTLSGELEGLYGAIAANYLKGIIDTQMNLKQRPKQPEQSNGEHRNGTSHNDTGHHHDHDHHGPIGALDMGGSSTQIVYLAGKQQPGTTTATVVTGDHHHHDPPTCHNYNNDNHANDDNNDDDDDDAVTIQQTCHISQQPSFEIPTTTTTQLNGDDFFSTSYLSYGVDQFRERLWDTWIQDRIQNYRHKDRQQYNNTDDDDEDDEDEDSCMSYYIENPCSFIGYEQEWKGYILFGTGDTDNCIRQVQRLIPHPDIPYDIDNDIDDDDDDVNVNNIVGGVEHPPIQGKFFAMSVYFFALDSLRVLSLPTSSDNNDNMSSSSSAAEAAYELLNRSWPTPSIEELENALYGLCSRHWENDLKDIQHTAHTYTKASILPHRCLESVYLVTLLKDGFGFHPTSRNITFTFDVNGNEVEWTLGMAIALHSATTTAAAQQQFAEMTPTTLRPTSNTSSSSPSNDHENIPSSSSSLSTTTTTTTTTREINATTLEEPQECFTAL